MSKPMDIRVLAALLTSKELITSIDLIGLVWTSAGYTQPKTARQILRNTICRLRTEGFRIESSRKKNGNAGFRLLRDTIDSPSTRILLEQALA